MVANVSSIEGESSVLVSFLCSLYVYLTVLHYLIMVVIATDHTHSFSRLHFLHYLKDIKAESQKTCTPMMSLLHPV